MVLCCCFALFFNFFRIFLEPIGNKCSNLSMVIKVSKLINFTISYPNKGKVETVSSGNKDFQFSFVGQFCNKAASKNMFHQVILSAKGVSFQCGSQEDMAAAENLSSPIPSFSGHKTTLPKWTLYIWNDHQRLIETTDNWSKLCILPLDKRLKL